MQEYIVSDPYLEIISTIIFSNNWYHCHFKNKSFQYKQSALLAKGKWEENISKIFYYWK